MIDIKVYSTVYCFQSSPHSWLITRFVARLTRWVPHVEQELLTLLEHLSSPPVFSGVHITPSLLLCVCFLDRCLSFCTFSFAHCVVCPSSIYGFWLPLWYLRTLFKCSKVYCLQNNLTETSTTPFIIILQINQVSEIIFDRIIHTIILVYNNHLGLSNNRYMQNTCYTSNYNRFISTTKIYQYLNKLWLIMNI